MALKTAFKTVKFYAARQGLQVCRVVSGGVLQLNLVDETSVTINNDIFTTAVLVGGDDVRIQSNHRLGY